MLFLSSASSPPTFFFLSGRTEGRYCRYYYTHEFVVYIYNWLHMPGAFLTCRIEMDVIMHAHCVICSSVEIIYRHDCNFYDYDIGFLLSGSFPFETEKKNFVWNCLGDGSTYFVTPLLFIYFFLHHVCSNISLRDFAVE